MGMVLLLWANIEGVVIEIKLGICKNVVRYFSKQGRDLEGKVKVSKGKIKVEFLEL